MSDSGFERTQSLHRANLSPREITRERTLPEMNDASIKEPITRKRVSELVNPNTIRQERLRQARISFNLAYMLTVLGATICFVGIMLFWSGKLSEGAAVVAGGLLSTFATTYSLRLNKIASEHLNELTEDLKEEISDSDN